MKLGGISIVVTNWNGRALLEKFLPSVIESARAFESESGEPTEVLIADDASTDDSANWVRAYSPEVRFESCPSQRGFAPTANRGVRAARFPLIFLLNNDVALAADTLPPLAQHFRDENVFAVTGNVYDFATGVLRGAGQRGRFRRGFLSVHSRYFVPSPRAEMAPFATIFASGGSSLYDREKFIALGGFDEMFAPYGWEDVDLSLRAWKRGYQLRYEPRSAVWHQFSSTIGERIARRRVSVTYERNRMLMHWLHLDTKMQRASHYSGLAARVVSAAIAGRIEYWQAFWQAAALREELRVRRDQLRTKQQRTLAEVLRRVEAEMSRPEVRELNSSTVPVRPCRQLESFRGAEARSGKAR